jgi:acyl-CoA synthetase (AMP-forming)/AMP-acid ligase II
MANLQNLLDVLYTASDKHTAVVLPETGVNVSYACLREQVTKMAEALMAAGVQQGTRVATVLPNGLSAVVSFLAASIVGTAAPLNPDYREDEISFYLKDTDARILLCPDKGGQAARQAAQDRIPVYSVEEDSRGIVRLSSSSDTRNTGCPDPDAIALMLHTSGSTGRPKRVPLRHCNLATSAHNVVKTYNLSPDDVTLGVMPLFHVHGLVASTLATFLSGGILVLPTKFNVFSFWRTVRDFHVTWYSAVPTIHQVLLSRTGEERPPGCEGLRFIRSCSAALPPRMMEKIESVFSSPVLEAYGMTEAAHQMCSNPRPPGIRKSGSVGPGTGVEVRIIGEGDNFLGVGERGEVVILGPSVMSGYENHPEANVKSFVNGWFRTGDEGFLDSDGYLTLTGRLKELINRGGEKIAPREIDEVLLSHPAVLEAVSFGVPNTIWGEEVAAAVVLREPASESTILAHCRGQLADFKCPKQLYVVKAIPRTATGKIQRAAVASAIVEERR